MHRRKRFEDEEVTPVIPIQVMRPDAVTWRLAAPHLGESCRWTSSDGRWIALTIAEGHDLGKVIVQDSNGRSVFVESYEEGLSTARAWRTG